MSEKNEIQESVDKLIKTITIGFENFHQDKVQREKILKNQCEHQIEMQDRKNRKWRYGAVIVGVAMIVLGYSLHKTINTFKYDMKYMSIYMKSMSADMSSMKNSMEVMSPQMVSMAQNMASMKGNIENMAVDINKVERHMDSMVVDMRSIKGMAVDINKIGGHIESMDHSMGYMGRDVKQMNNAMSPLMNNMQTFFPRNW